MTKTVKLLGLILLFVLATNISYSQKCKYEYQKTDELSGKTNKAILYEASSTLNFRFKASGNVYEMNILIYFSGFNMGSAATKTPLEAGDSIVFKLNTGELIKINAPKQIEPDMLQDKLALYHLYSPIPVSKEVLDKLSNSIVSYIRVTLGTQVYDKQLKDKEAKLLQDKLKCILQ